MRYVPDFPIEQLKPAEYNPRQATSKEYADLKRSIQEFGLVDPVIANEHGGRENIIIGGHFRVRVAKDMGIKTVPVVFVDLDEDREKMLNLRLNRNTGSWDWDALASFEKELLLDVGFSETELDVKLTGEADIEPEVRFTEELHEEQNYVVLYFNTDIDWLQLLTLWPLENVQALASKPGFQKVGIGRVINGAEFIKKLLGGT